MLSQTVQLNDNGSAKVCGGNTELRFGYTKNANVYSINFELSPEWDGLYLRVFWHVPEGDDPSSSLVVDRSVTVPPTVTAITGVGKITLEGTDGVKTITSSDITYRVSKNSGTSDDTDPEPGSSAWEQFVNEVKADADRAEASADAAKLSETNSKASETAAKLSETNSKASETAAKLSETNSKASETAAKLSETNSATSAAAAKQSEINAKASETEATKQAGIAKQYSDTSKENSDSSSKSASLASASASAAKQSETEATKQAGIALEKADLASTSADLAKLSETASKLSETNSKASETNAKRSETASASSASAAKQSATASATSEANSKASENKSLEYMNAAKGYSEAASSSATSSENSYQNAHKAAQDAEAHASAAISSENESARILGEVKSTASAAKDELTTAKNNYLTELSDAKASHISSMEDKASELTETSKKDIETAKETALSEIAATNKKLPDITADDAGKSLLVNKDGTEFVLGDPPVVSYTKEESDARYAPIESSVRSTANGNLAVCEDSIAWAFQDLKVYGKSTQDGTPSPENPVPIVSAGEGGDFELAVTGKNLLDISKMQQRSVNGITFSFENGGIKVNGTSTANADSPTFSLRLQPGNYIANMNKTLHPWLNSVNYVVEKKDGNLLYLNAERAFTVLDEYIGKYFYFVVENGNTVNEILYPQLELGSISTSYEPYVLQSLPISTPNGLPGIPVDSGGNYVDGTGQQWICDVVDFGTQAFIKNVCTANPKNLNVTNFAPYGNNGFVRIALSTPEKAIKAATTSKCKYFKTLYSCNDESEHFYWTENVIYIFSDRWNTKEDFEFWLNALDNSEVFAIAEIENSTFTLISSEELAAYRALQTYAGITVVSTAEPVAGIEATYIVDPKKYIDKKIESAVSEAVTSAITLMQGGV